VEVSPKGLLDSRLRFVGKVARPGRVEAAGHLAAGRFTRVTAFPASAQHAGETPFEQLAVLSAEELEAPGLVLVELGECCECSPANTCNSQP